MAIKRAEHGMAVRVLLLLPAGHEDPALTSDSEMLEPGAAAEDAGHTVQETDYKVMFH
jgi:hypothetical protein